MYYPLQSLEAGHWFKLICGASFQHLPAVRNLTLAYGLAGVDCVDVAADPAVIASAREAIAAVADLKSAAQARGYRFQTLPWLMVSLNDGEDPHFRKATFDPTRCPPDCTRPCEVICPAQAIAFPPRGDVAGVIDSRCYGCGRCLPVCPMQHISTRTYVSTPSTIIPLTLQGVDAVEIHTQVGRFTDFQRLWRAIAPWLSQLKVVAVSCPDGEGFIDYLWSLYDLIMPLPCPLIWQIDGRPMSGDIGDGATRATVKLGQKVLAAGVPGYVQLAGGTNRYTVPKLAALGLLKPPQDDSILHDVRCDRQPESKQRSHRVSDPPSKYIAGIGYGSYARALLTPILNQVEASASTDPLLMPEAGLSMALSSASDMQIPSSEVAHSARFNSRLEANPDLLWQAVHLAYSLVSQLKAPMPYHSLISR